MWQDFKLLGLLYNKCMKILLTGSTGQLGSYLLPALLAAKYDVVAIHSKTIGADFCEPEGLYGFVRECGADVIVNAAALATPGGCYAWPAKAKLINTTGPEVLADVARREGMRIIHLSTDMVFDGEKGWYCETDETGAKSIYGETKRAGELPVLDIGGIVLRLSLLFGPSKSGKANFFDQQVSGLRGGDEVRLFHDEIRTPLSYVDAANAIMGVIEADAMSGLYHVGGSERLTRLEMGIQLAKVLDVSESGIVSVSRESIDAAEPRPGDCSLDSTRFYGEFPHLKPVKYQSQACRLLGIDELA